MDHISAGYYHTIGIIHANSGFSLIILVLVLALHIYSHWNDKKNSQSFNASTCVYLQVSSKDEAMSENLHALCCAHDVPICIVRGLADVLDVNLELFSSESLVKTYGEQEIEVRIQVSSPRVWELLGKFSCISTFGWMSTINFV